MSTPAPILQYTLNNKDLLPAGYTPLAYIESTGTQYIDTGIVFNNLNNALIAGKAIFTDSNSEYAVIFGSTGAQTHINVVLRLNSYLYFDYGGNNGICLYSNIIKNQLFEVYTKVTTSGISTNVNGVAKSSSTAPTVSGTRRNSYLFAYNSNGSVTYLVKAKIHYWRIWIDNQIVSDLRPARRDSDGVIGMYDLVSRTFKTNSGSGSFIAGPELAVGKGGGKSLPEEYLLVEWILNINKTEYISINRTVKSNTVMKANLAITAYKSNNYNLIMGYAASTSWQPYSLGISSSNVICTYGGSCSISGTPPSTFTTITWTSSNSSETSGSTLGLFKATGSPGDSSYPPALLKISYAEILEGSTLLYRLFPCYRKSDMKPGMYDTVNGVFYTNAGSGEFILGPTVTNCYTWEPNAGSGTYQGLYTNLSGIYDSSKGWVADFTNNTTHLSTTISAVGNNFSVAWWELSSNFNDGSMPWGIYPFNPLYSKCLNTGDGSSNPWYKSGTTAIDNITNGVWHHFVVTGNGSTNYLYVDGVKYGLSKTFKGLTGTSLVINGWDLATSYCRNPKISNFLIFNVALTDAQVKELYGQ